MKTNIIGFLVIAILASTSFAQNKSTTQMQQDEGISSKGLRVSIVRPNLDGKAKANYNGLSLDVSEKIDETLGIAIGYANLPVEEMGWTTNAAIMESKNNGTSANIARIDGSLAYAFNKYVNLKGGLNIIKFTSGKGVKDLNPGLGFQASAGLQITRNFGLDLGYVEMNASGKAPITYNGQEIGKADSDIKLTGFEIALNGTF